MGNTIQTNIIELNIKSAQDLKSTIKSLKVLNAGRVMLTDRDPSRPQLAYASEILAHLPEIEVNCVYSLGLRGQESGWEELSDYLSEAGKSGVQEVLIVSGEPKREGFDSVSALEYLKQQKYTPGVPGRNKAPKVSVAYNPYLPAGEIEVENQRLQEKLDSGLVSGVYLQLGEDADALINGISLVRSLSQVEILAAILTPSAGTIARLKENTWPGVYYKTFYEGEEAAKSVNSRIESVCKQAGIYIYFCGAI